jgi:hypothetical protein
MRGDKPVVGTGPSEVDDFFIGNGVAILLRLELLRLVAMFIWVAIFTRSCNEFCFFNLAITFMGESSLFSTSSSPSLHSVGFSLRLNWLLPLRDSEQRFFSVYLAD